MRDSLLMSTKIEGNMKYLILITIGVCTSLSIRAQLRSSDIAVVFNDPKNGDTINISEDVPYDFWLINRGIDSLFDSDSLKFSIGLNHTPNELNHYIEELGVYVRPGDSVLIRSKISISTEAPLGEATFLFRNFASIISVSGSDRTMMQEVFPGIEDNKDYVDVVLVKKTAGIKPDEIETVKVYPNPIRRGGVIKMQISSNENDLFFSLTDPLGRVFYPEELERETSTMTLLLPNDILGVCVLSAYSEESVYRRKIFIK